MAVVRRLWQRDVSGVPLPLSCGDGRPSGVTGDPQRLAMLLPLALAPLAFLSCVSHALLLGDPGLSSRAAAVWALTVAAAWLPVLGLWTRAARRLRGRALWTAGLMAAASAVSVEYLMRMTLGNLPDAPAPWLLLAVHRAPLAVLLLAAGVWIARRAAAAPTLTLHDHRGRREVPVSQVCYLRAEENYVAVHLRDGGRGLLRARFGRLAEALAGHGLVRIHRGLAVQRAAVARLASDRLWLHDGTVLRIGRSHRAAARAALSA